jgi:hypothetical protein
MVREENAVTSANSDYGSAMAARTADPSKIPCLQPAAAANGQDLSWIEGRPTGWDAPISVWWDCPPWPRPSLAAVRADLMINTTWTLRSCTR